VPEQVQIALSKQKNYYSEICNFLAEREKVSLLWTELATPMPENFPAGLELIWKVSLRA
jgi:hypothetical protein